MYFKQISIHIVFLVVCIITVSSLKKDEFFCEKSSPCICVSANNDIIDLSGINLTLIITTNMSLHYQPCPNDELSPNIVAINMVDTTANTTIPLAYYMDVQFEINDAVMLVYKNFSNEFDVILSCDPSAKSGNEYLTNFQNESDHYSIILKTSKVCGLNLSDSIKNSNSDSWTFFFSFILVVAFIYFVGGSVVNACLFNEVGVSMIPHHVFWSSLYNNIKDKLCGTATMASAYESI